MEVFEKENFRLLGAQIVGFEAYNFSGGFRFYDTVMHDRALIETASACGTNL